MGYVIENVSARTLNGLYAGHYVDPDVDDDVVGDTTAYDPTRQMGYQPDTTDVGLRYVWGGVHSYNNMDCCIGSDAEAYTFVSNGDFDAPYTSGDLVFVLGSGPFSLAPGDAYLLGTAWVAGDSLADLQANADRALAMWLATDGCGAGLPEIEEEFVPEPGSVLLLASGLMGLAGYAGLRKWKR